VTLADVEEIVESHVIGGKVVERLLQEEGSEPPELQPLDDPPA
jgi:(2Fe-2S) ferredoxin